MISKVKILNFAVILSNDLFTILPCNLIVLRICSCLSMVCWMSTLAEVRSKHRPVVGFLIFISITVPLT